MFDHDIIIIGSGVSGLSCAKILNDNNKKFVLYESQTQVGGRMSTDLVGEHKLDRGFQVFIKGYPLYNDVSDVDQLSLYSFLPGALIRLNNRFYKVVDPFRNIIEGFKSIFTPIGSLLDKLKILKLRISLLLKPSGNLTNNISTYNYLKNNGFSEEMINNFFVPFFGSVLLDKDLSTVKSTFETVYKAMSSDNICLPENGIVDFPKSIYNQLPKDQFCFNTEVTAIDNHVVTFADGTSTSSKSIVIATDATTASNLTQSFKAPLYCGTTCLYFVTSRQLIKEPMIITNAGEGFINTICCLTNVNHSYSSQNLISVNVNKIIPDITHDEIVDSVKLELQSWFPEIDFDFVKLYEIPNALPKHTPSEFNRMRNIPQGENGVYFCGDYLYGASVNDAIKSGLETAEIILSLD